MMIRNLAFDLDGTLITCENKQKYLLFALLVKLRASLSDRSAICDDWWKLKREGSNTAEALKLLKIPEPDYLANEWKESIENIQWQLLDTPFDDTLLTLKFLVDSLNCQIYILTARKCHHFVHQEIKRFGFEDYITDVFISNPYNVEQEKALVLQKIKPLLFIGDSESDFRASVSANTPFIALSRGQRSSIFLASNGIERIEPSLAFLQNEKYFTSMI